MYFLLKLVALLPLSLLQLIATWFALLLNSFECSIKRITRINVQLAYPDLNAEQYKILIKNSLKSQCMTYIESQGDYVCDDCRDGFYSSCEECGEYNGTYTLEI